MKKQAGSLILFLFLTIYAVSQQLFQLAPPFIKYGSVFFKDEVKVALLFAQPGTVTRYTTNGSEPTENDAAYKEPIRINKSFTVVKAKVFGKNFLPSETTEATFIKDGLQLKTVACNNPDETYTGEGENTLMDNKGGIISYTSKTWLGFKQDTINIIISLPKKQKVNAVLFNLLQDYGSWIFFPQKAELYIPEKEGSGFKKSGEINFNPDQKKDISVSKPFLINFKRKVKTDKVKLQLYLLKNIPDWHPGKGQSSWIFIDEVKLY
jgi:hypothetical protein